MKTKRVYRFSGLSCCRGFHQILIFFSFCVNSRRVRIVVGNCRNILISGSWLEASAEKYVAVHPGLRTGAAHYPAVFNLCCKGP